ncbi:nitrate transport protein [Xanthomonas citri pv. aurantifolii str. ICPB 11122]|nr:nitrate transport protein [Xanthomonas citri pv. aurantifolii str. ICPB 11122]
MRATGWQQTVYRSLMAARAAAYAALASALLLASIVWAQPALAAEPAQLRIGYQKAVSSLVLAKQHRLLEQRFAQTKITWVEFPAGPQLLEALNVGSIDLGGAGDIPPLFAQAAGADLLYVGWVPPTPKAETILVPSKSALRTVADLKGKRVAFQKGSSAHNLLLRLLAKSGLGMRDITPLYLSPANARAAFAAGQVDAWAIWDPWYSALTLDGSARLLANGEGLGLTGGFFLSSRRYATAWGPFVQQVMGTLNQADGLLERDRAGSIKILAQVSGLPPAVVERHAGASPAGQRATAQRAGHQGAAGHCRLVLCAAPVAQTRAGGTGGLARAGCWRSAGGEQMMRSNAYSRRVQGHEVTSVQVCAGISVRQGARQGTITEMLR